MLNPITGHIQIHDEALRSKFSNFPCRLSNYMLEYQQLHLENWVCGRGRQDFE